MAFVVDKVFFRKLLRYHSGWDTDPLTFLEVIVLVDHSMKLGIDAAYLEPGKICEQAHKLAKAMIFELEMDISPYKDFDELLANYQFHLDIAVAIYELNEMERTRMEHMAKLEKSGRIPLKDLAHEGAADSTISYIMGKLSSHVDFR